MSEELPDCCWEHPHESDYEAAKMLTDPHDTSQTELTAAIKDVLHSYFEQNHDGSPHSDRMWISGGCTPQSRGTVIDTVILADCITDVVAARRAVQPSPDLRTALSRWVPAALLEQALADVSAVGRESEGRGDEQRFACALEPDGRGGFSVRGPAPPSATEGLEAALEFIAHQARYRADEAKKHPDDAFQRGLAQGSLTFGAYAESALAAAARQASAESGAGGWRPISEAPQGCDPVLLIAKYPSGGGWSDVYHGWRMGAGTWARWTHQFPPTHFMPLPAPPPPARDSGSGGEG